MLDEKKVIKLLDLFILDAVKSVLPWVKETGRGLQTHKELVRVRKNKIDWEIKDNIIYSEILLLKRKLQEFYMDITIEINGDTLKINIDNKILIIEKNIHNSFIILYDKVNELFNLIKKSKEQIFNERINLLSEQLLKED